MGEGKAQLWGLSGFCGAMGMITLLWGPLACCGDPHLTVGTPIQLLGGLSCHGDLFP